MFVCICQVHITWLCWIYLHIYWFCVLIVRMWSLGSLSPSQLWNRKEMLSRGASLFLRSSSKPCLRPNQTGQWSVSKEGMHARYLFLEGMEVWMQRISETLSRGLFLVLRIYFVIRSSRWLRAIIKGFKVNEGKYPMMNIKIKRIFA